MNRNNVHERFDFARRMKGYQSSHIVVVGSSVELEKSSSDSLLSIIYAPDGRTGLPTGDLNYYVSDKANEDVKAFILKNLMLDVSSARNIPNPSGLSDDALLELSIGSNESVDEYVQRLSREIDTFKFFQEQIKKQNVPSESGGSPVSAE